MLAVVRASRPTFRSPQDKLAWAVHAFLLAQGFKLVATGPAAEDESTDFSADRDEVAPDGWDALPGAYAFRYLDTEGQRAPLYLKCLAVGDQLLLHWTAGTAGQNPGSGGGGGGGGASAPAAGEPGSLELDAAAYTTDAATAPACYKHMAQLLAKLSEALGGALAGKPASAAAAAASERQAGGASTSGRGRARREHDPLLDPTGVSGIGYRPPGVPVGIGAHDVVPPGVRPPGYGGGPIIPGLMEPGPLHGGGGMQVGSHDPLFGPGRMGGGRGLGGAPLPPGARWDPIAPPGMRGFNPDDFQQPPGQVHPDMAQPGPGRGTDWDRMFG
ncbi:putative proteasome inhibitor [Micractinium conductrix]|uniref:Proteasome inhibitor n=1 Tax=Micractinium conductrix TaxID=554055 RepID=A0A2P6VR77_9CHLO|nr:putative proteasome inhibitor [Micractinium conductrix]|eukprot:PSC76580.1 putative proteasome inhibitor [Micractinium conductrix]